MNKQQEEKFLREMVKIYVDENPFINNKEAAVDYVIKHEPLRQALLAAYGRGFADSLNEATKLANPKRRSITKEVLPQYEEDNE